ncbi:MAG: hypothetical protein ACK4P2_00105 [Hyphomonas sp.]
MAGDVRSEITPHLASWIAAAVTAAPPGHIPLLFLSGPQGSGKSTALAEAVAVLPLPVLGISIDDFYLTRAGREALAREISPLYITRGPPGTHDLALLRQTIAALKSADGSSPVLLPAFDKLADDRRPAAEWTAFQGRPAAIIIEGWLMGALPDAAAPATPPVNKVEAEDTTGHWRRHQEEALAGPYAALWDMADSFFHLSPPGFGCVLGWRLQQEAGLWQACGEPVPEDRPAWAARFISHYERISRRMIDGMRRPGTELRIDTQRRVL